MEEDVVVVERLVWPHLLLLLLLLLLVSLGWACRWWEWELLVTSCCLCNVHIVISMVRSDESKCSNTITVEVVELVVIVLAVLDVDATLIDAGEVGVAVEGLILLGGVHAVASVLDVLDRGVLWHCSGCLASCLYVDDVVVVGGEQHLLGEYSWSIGEVGVVEGSKVLFVFCPQTILLCEKC